MGMLGVIGGSGLYGMAGLEAPRDERVATPFGEPSDRFRIGTIAGREVAFLARHGPGHRLLPSEINFRANIYGFRAIGVDRLVSVSAVGSMKESVHPLDIVLPDQFIDRTARQPRSFFGDGIAAHVSLAEPVCAPLLDRLAGAARDSGATLHRGGIYLCVEGPQFSTRAESTLYRSWGVDVIGMTNATEVRLAREAELCYATMAMVTDYDCWHDVEEAVTVEAVVARLHRNAETAEKVVAGLAAGLTDERPCRCGAALESAILTDRRAISPQARQRLALLVGRYLE
jgi:5'-methylthioadenosine phosphorylase